MSNLKKKYKIVKQTSENIWGNFEKIETFNTKQWKSIVRSLKDKNTKASIFNRKDNSLKTLYKRRLMNKQKIKSFYGNMSYKILKKYYVIIKNKNKKNIMDNLLVFLETRLDIFLYRIGLFSSIFNIKQAINHKKIKVNGVIVSYSGYILKKGDYITYDGQFINKNLVNMPYSYVNKEKKIIIFLRNPDYKEIKYPFNMNKKFLFEYLNKK